MVLAELNFGSIRIGSGPPEVCFHDEEDARNLRLVLEHHKVWHHTPTADERLDLSRVRVVQCPFWLAHLLNVLDTWYRPIVVHMLLEEYGPDAFDTAERLGGDAAVRSMAVDWVRRVSGLNNAQMALSMGTRKQVMTPADWDRRLVVKHRRSSLINGESLAAAMLVLRLGIHEVGMVKR